MPVDAVVLQRSFANDVHLVEPGHYLEVFRHGWRGAQEVAWECELITHLIEHGIAVAPARPARTVRRQGHGTPPRAPARWC